MSFSNILHSVLEFMNTGLIGLSGWEVVIYTLVVTHITIASVTIYLHRHQAHNSHSGTNYLGSIVPCVIGSA